MTFLDDQDALIGPGKYLFFRVFLWFKFFGFGWGWIRIVCGVRFCWERRVMVLNRLAKKMGQPDVAYPNYYTWLVFVSAMDILMTWAILYLGGSEANPVADAVILKWGLGGMIIFKFAIVVFFVVMCEWVARKRKETGRVLASCGIMISAFPSIYAVGLVLLHLYVG